MLTCLFICTHAWSQPFKAIVTLRLHARACLGTGSRPTPGQLQRHASPLNMVGGFGSPASVAAEDPTPPRSAPTPAYPLAGVAAPCGTPPLPGSTAVPQPPASTPPTPAPAASSPGPTNAWAIHANCVQHAAATDNAPILGPVRTPPVPAGTSQGEGGGPRPTPAAAGAHATRVHAPPISRATARLWQVCSAALLCQARVPHAQQRGVCPACVRVCVCTVGLSSK